MAENAEKAESAGTARRFRLAELASRLGARLRFEPESGGDGAGEVEVSGVASLREAGPEDVSFLISPRYRGEAEASRAGALLVGPKLATSDLGRSLAAAVPLLVVDDPELARNRVLELLHPPAPRTAGVHPTAVVEAGAEVAPSASIGPFAVVGGESRIGDGASVGAHTVIGRRCTVGAGSVLHPHVVLYDDTELGARVTVHSGTVLGADGFGYVSRADGHHKVPQVGRVVIGDDVEIGAVSAVDRATVGATRIGAGSKIDNLVQVGHNVEVGRAALLCGQSGIAGSSRLGDGVVLAGQAGVSGHLELGDRVQVGAASPVVRNVPAGTVVSSTVPAVEIGRWRRQAALLGRLDEMAKRLKALERRVGASSEASSDVRSEDDPEGGES